MQLFETKQQQSAGGLSGIVIPVVFVMIVTTIFSVFVMTVGWLLSMAFSSFTQFQATLIFVLTFACVLGVLMFVIIMLTMSQLLDIFQNAINSLEISPDDDEDDDDEDA